MNDFFLTEGLVSIIGSGKLFEIFIGYLIYLIKLLRYEIFVPKGPTRRRKKKRVSNRMGERKGLDAPLADIRSERRGRPADSSVGVAGVVGARGGFRLRCCLSARRQWRGRMQR